MTKSSRQPPLSLDKCTLAYFPPVISLASSLGVPLAFYWRYSRRDGLTASKILTQKVFDRNIPYRNASDTETTFPLSQHPTARRASMSSLHFTPFLICRLYAYPTAPFGFTTPMSFLCLLYLRDTTMDPASSRWKGRHLSSMALG